MQDTRRRLKQKAEEVMMLQLVGKLKPIVVK